MKLKPRPFLIVWLASLNFLFGCTTAQFDNCYDIGSSTTPRITIDEAKAAFEETYSASITKSGNDKRHRNKLYPGEFTPLWDNAAYSENSRACSYDVKLITERKVYAIVAEFRNGKSVAEKVLVHQRLVTIKNESYPRTCCYLLSLIPDCGCDGGDRMAEQFRSSADKGLFSGLAVYSALGSGAILRIDRYRNGVQRDGVYIPSRKGSLESRLAKAASMLRGISLINKRAVTTKSFGEDSWDDGDYDWGDGDSDGDDGWDYGDPNDYTDIGGGFFEDEDGNKYFDTDGDGVPDSMVIEGGGINGNDDGDDDKDDNGLDDSWWLWNPNPDDNGNEGYNPEDDPYYKDDDNYDGHTETKQDEDDEDYKRGKEGLKKMQEDLENGNVKMLEVVNGMLTGLGVGANANGIIISAASCIREFADMSVIKCFGHSLGTAGIIMSTAQTCIVGFDDGKLSTAQVLSIISSALQIGSFLTEPIPVVFWRIRRSQLHYWDNFCLHR